MYAAYHKSRSADGGYFLLNIIRYDVGYLHSLKSWLVASLIMPRKQKTDMFRRTVTKNEECIFACRSVRSVRQRSRRMAAAITWCASDANTTSVGSASLHGSHMAHLG